MRAMILAAGRGERMQHLTDNLPKPLLKFAGNYLIDYSLAALAKAGIKSVVINVCYKSELIKNTLGSKRFGIEIIYSEEKEALETGGGILAALPYLGSEPFYVLSCDIISNYSLLSLPQHPEKLAHVVLVDNPDFHPRGDFCLQNNTIFLEGSPTFTFSNIGVYRPELFASCKPGKFRLGDILKQAAASGQVTGEHFAGFWQNVGTPMQLESKVVLPDNLL